MLPSSVRRVVTTAPQSSSALSTLVSSVPRAASGYALSCASRRHQRRCSSSKPSNPDNGPKDIPAGQSVPASSSSSSSSSSASSSQSAKSSGEKRGRKPKDQQSPTQKLPSVPSTQHLPLDTLALSSFFSQHRPISITHSLPKAVTDDIFASIFSPRTRSQRSSEVINTLSKTVGQLETPMASLTMQDAEQADDGMHRIELRHPDGSESSVYVQLNAMSGQFLPFQPPPLPEPETEAQAAEAGMEPAAEEEEEEPQRRVYKAVLTIEEQRDANGEIKILAHSPQIIEEPAPARSFLERMAIRHLKYEEVRAHRERMLAISVKRQRKLKMKKKKYKKLMKRTRNLRRKQDRI